MSIISKGGVVLEGGQVLYNVHDSSLCTGRPCPIHNMTDHHMRSWPQNFRQDNGLMERICEHGVGHPDFDSLPYFEELGIECMDVHGCCWEQCCTQGNQNPQNKLL